MLQRNDARTHCHRLLHCLGGYYYPAGVVMSLLYLKGERPNYCCCYYYFPKLGILIFWVIRVVVIQNTTMAIKKESPKVT